MSNCLLSYFPDTDLRCGHDGLSILAKKGKKPVDKLKVGQFLVFVNRAQTAVKILTIEGVLIHIRPEHGLNFEAINKLPKYFNGTRFNYTGALRETLKKRLDDRHLRRLVASKPVAKLAKAA